MDVYGVNWIALVDWIVFLWEGLVLLSWIAQDLMVERKPLSVDLDCIVIELQWIEVNLQPKL